MKLLQLKHWQLFLITFAIPLVAYIIGFAIFAMSMLSLNISRAFENYEPARKPEVPGIGYFIPLIIAGIIALTGVVVHYLWMYKTATKLQQFMHPEMRKLKTNRFRLFFFSPMVYIVLLLIVFPGAFLGLEPGVNSVPAGILFFFIFMFLGHTYSAFCGIYVLYFAAKTVKSAELQREAHFSDYIGEFFLIWFFPVGVWLIQPRINKMITGSENPEIYSTRNYNSF